MKIKNIKISEKVFSNLRIGAMFIYNDEICNKNSDKSCVNISGDIFSIYKNKTVKTITAFIGF